MPPEPLPWERNKEYVLKDHRKHERGTGLDASGGSGSGGGSSSSTSRWRDSYHASRDFPRASPRRQLPGHYRQGGDHQPVYPEDSGGGGHGCTPSRSDRFYMEDENFRFSSSRYGSGGRSSGSSRDSRGLFRRASFWASGDFSRPQHDAPHVTAQRSVAVPISSPSQPVLKDQNDKVGGASDDGLVTGHKSSNREHSLSSTSWKPSMKWSRPGSLSSTKTSRSDMEDASLEVVIPPGKETPIRSPVASPLPADDDPAKKKPRLGWGQGLAKYEKQKVEQFTDASVSASKGALSDTSPKVTGLSGCLSPATPCSATCSSSPGTEDKTFVRSGDGDNDKISKHNLTEGSVDEVPIRLDQLEVSSISSLTSLLADLLQPEDACYGDSTFARNSATSKLLILKEDISKELEKTECDIDLFENELRSLEFDSKSDYFRSSSTDLEFTTHQTDVSNDSTHAEDPSIASPSDVVVVKELSPSADLVEQRNVGTRTMYDPEKSSENCQSMSLGKEVSEIDLRNLGECTLNAEVGRLKIGKGEPITDTDGGRENQMTASGLGIVNWANGDDSFTHENFDAAALPTSCSNLISLIMETNKDIARQASMVFESALHTNPSPVDIWGLVDLHSCRRNDLKVKEKLSARKRLLKFKEHALTLKFIALHHLWKEDLRLLSLRRNRPRWSKRFELRSRFLQNGSKKQRSSIRTRFALPAGNLTLVPTTEIVNFTSKLLLDSQIKICRSYLKTPALILDDKERMDAKFITYNGLIEDGPNFEEQRAMINPWSHEEKEVFLEMLATFGKDFTKISPFLKHKTTADCVEFYYQNHKSESFKEVRKLLKLRKQRQCVPVNTYLVTSGKMLNPEENAVSLDMLGAASLIASHAHGSASRQQKYVGKAIYGASNGWTASYGSYSCLERDSSVEISSHERESVAADVLAGISGALSSEAMTSCVTSSIYPSEKMKYVAVDPPFIAEVSQNFDEENIYSDEGCGESDSTDWTDEEKSVFVRALSIYGKDFAKISTCVKTRSREQCKIFYSKARKCLGLDMIHQDADNGHIPLSDANGGRSDTDDACAAEMDSAICSIQSCSKVEADISHSVEKTGSEQFAHAGSSLLPIKAERSIEQDAIEADLEREYNLDNKLSICCDDKLGNMQNKSKLDMPPKESGDAESRSNDTGRHHDIVDSVVPETKGGESSAFAPTETLTMICTEAETKIPTASFVHGEVAVGASPVNVVKMEEDLKPLPVPEAELMNTQTTNIDFTLSSSSSLCFTVDSNGNGPALVQENKVNVCPPLSVVANYQHRPQLDLPYSLPKKPQSFSLKQENAHCASLNSIFPEASSICFGGQLNILSHTSLSFEEHGNKRHQSLVNRDLYQHYMIRNPAWNQVDQNLQVLRGYPLQVLNQDIKREDPILEKPVLLEAFNKKNGVSHSNQFFLSDMHGRQGNVTTLLHSRPGILCPSGSESQSEAQLRLCFQKSASDVEENRTGDVKLFGKILSHPSSLQTPSSLAHQSNNKPSSMMLSMSSTLNPSNAGKDSNLPASRPSSSGQNGLEEVPVRSYGFWDGNRIQTGFTSLPESAVMLTKYQGPLSEVSFYSGKDGISSSSGLLTDCQKSFMQHLSSDGKRLDTFSEFQKRNGIEMVPVLPQQGKVARLGANVLGGGLLVGSGGVSDPVAALKLHYAARSKTFSNEVESWRADIGGR